MTSRRDFLKTAAVAGAIFGLGSERALLANTTREAALNAAKGRAKNIIFMVADGMNLGSLAATRHFQKLVLGKENEWMSLYRTHPVVRCLMETSNANSIVTDSASASSSWGAGQRVKTGQINMSAEDGSPLEPICVKMRKAGKATGLVTTATVTHATPAGFAANSKNRGDEKLFARQYLERKIDVIMGGGAKFFDEQLRGEYQGGGYDLVTSRDAMLQAKGEFKPLLGIFTESYLPFTIERDSTPDLQKQVPTLAEMAQLALERLSKAPNGFLLQIEGARVDHAAHSNDAATLIHDQMAFDAAIAVVREFAEKNPDTLVVITTDHGCGGMNINGIGNLYADTTRHFERLGKFTRSFGQMKDEAKGLSREEMRAYMQQVTGIRLSGDRLNASRIVLKSVAEYSADTMKEKKKEFAAKGLGSMAEIFQWETGIGWTSGGDTGELVEFTAFGPSAQLFPPFVRNDEVHNILLRAAGIA